MTTNPKPTKVSTEVEELVEELLAQPPALVTQEELNAYKARATQLIDKAENKIAKAYGGCEKCYGKGYATVWSGVKSSADFYGDKGFVTKPKNNIKFCSCDRGKQLCELTTKEQLK